MWVLGIAAEVMAADLRGQDLEDAPRAACPAHAVGTLSSRAAERCLPDPWHAAVQAVLITGGMIAACCGCVQKDNIVPCAGAGSVAAAEGPHGLVS